MTLDMLLLGIAASWCVGMALGALAAWWLK
jgi:hypothetical protein